MGFIYEDFGPAKDAMVRRIEGMSADAARAVLVSVIESLHMVGGTAPDWDGGWDSCTDDVLEAATTAADIFDPTQH